MRDARARFWQAWSDGVLLLQTCARCAQPRFYVSPLCPHCGWPTSRQQPAIGTGEIHSLTIVPQRDGPPRVVVLVTLTENVRVLGVLEGSVAPAIGDAVRIVSNGSANGPIRFAPAKPDASSTA